MIKRAPRAESNFYILDKKISEDENLTWAARGLLVFLLGKSDNWEVSIAHLQKQTDNTVKPTKRDGIYNLINELIASGYVQRTYCGRESGKFAGLNYIVSEIPVTPLPDTGKTNQSPPDTGKPDTDEPDTEKTTQVSNDIKQELNNSKNGVKQELDKTPKEHEKTREEWFDHFYSTYPKKIKKEQALALWKKIDQGLYQMIIDDVENRSKNHFGWREKQYVCAPDVYLRNKRWSDEIEIKQGGNNGSTKNNFITGGKLSLVDQAKAGELRVEERMRREAERSIN